MSAVRFSSEVGIDAEIVQGLETLGVGELLKAIMQEFGTAVRNTWTRRARDKGVESSNYLARIGEAQVSLAPPTPTQMVFQIEVENTHPRADIIENGHAAFHLPSRINWAGPKVKHGKSGPYLHIPFRHRAFETDAEMEASGTTVATRKQMMPRDIYEAAKRLRPRIPLREGPIYDDQGRYVAADRYAWGGRPNQRHRLPADAGVRREGTNLVSGQDSDSGVEVQRPERPIAGRIGGKPASNPAWQTPKFGGLFKSTGDGHTAYLTVRTITPNSKGWNIPARLGIHVVPELESQMRANAQTWFEDALEAALTGGGEEVEP